ncbi:MAG: amidase [bacterium]
MKRREFLQTTVAGGSALTLTGLPSCAKLGEENAQTSAHTVQPFELDELTIPGLQEGMQSGKYTAESITELYLERIEALDKQGPALHAVIETNPDALEIAKSLDTERNNDKVRGPLHGIPVLIKDNIDTADRMTTTAGSYALEGSIPKQDSFVAQKLREAGAIILGKANLSEWANFRSTRSSSGWSGRGGQARNPYALDRNPCGSSSGSGIAAAATLCAVAIGTETNGSVVCPSTANGIVGIKPTVGLLSRSGIIPIAHSQDTAGPMARTVRDAAILLGALTGIDARDDATRQSEGKAHRDYTQFLDSQGMNGARIGVARNYFGFHEMVDKLVEDAIDVMKQLGATVVDEANIETRNKYGDSGFAVLLYEFKTNLNKYLATLDDSVPVHTLEELIAFNSANKEKEMPYFGQEILKMAQEKGDLDTPEYKEALAKIHRLSRDEGIDATLKKHNIDAIIAPTGGPAWLTDWINGDHYVGGSSSPAARAGYPNITVPAGFIHGLPVGISFFSRAWNEPQLIKFAYAFEQATHHRKSPQFLPHVQMSM